MGNEGGSPHKNGKGNYENYVSVPGTGVSYVQESKNNRVQDPQNSFHEDPSVTRLEHMTSTETLNINDYQSAEYYEVLTQIRKVIKVNFISNLLILTFILSIYPIFLLTGFSGLLLKLFVYLKMPVTMEYTFDQKAEVQYSNLSSLWMSLNSNSLFWQIVAEGGLNSKTSGGAARGVARINAKAIQKLPFYIKTNIEPFGLALRKQKIYFLPDKLLVISGLNVGAVNYSEIFMGLGTTQFVETEAVPKDAHVIGYTWLKVNKNGTPDKRFKENREVPVCEYGNIRIRSGNILNIELMCSNSNTVEDMKSYASVFRG